MRKKKEDFNDAVRKEAFNKKHRMLGRSHVSASANFKVATGQPMTPAEKAHLSRPRKTQAAKQAGSKFSMLGAVEPISKVQRDWRDKELEQQFDADIGEGAIPAADKKLAEEVVNDVDAALSRSPVESQKDWVQRRQAEIADNYRMSKLLRRKNELGAIRKQRLLKPSEVIEFRKAAHIISARERVRQEHPGESLAALGKEVAAQVDSEMAKDRKKDQRAGEVVDWDDRSALPGDDLNFKPRGVSDEEWAKVRAASVERTTAESAERVAQRTAKMMGASPSSSPSRNPPSSPSKAAPSAKGGTLSDIANWFPHLVKNLKQFGADVRAGLAATKTKGPMSAATATAGRIGASMASSSIKTKAVDDAPTAHVSAGGWQRTKRGSEFRLGKSGKKIYKSKQLSKTTQKKRDAKYNAGD